MQYKAVPVKITSDILAAQGSTTTPATGSLLFCNGVFYAQLAMDGQDKPFTIALHGVSSELEATQALGAILPHPRRESSPLLPLPQYGN